MTRLKKPASEIDAYDRAVVVAGEVAALPLEAAFSDDVLVAVAGKETDGRGRVVRGISSSDASRISGLISTARVRRAPSVAMSRFMASMS